MAETTWTYNVQDFSPLLEYSGSNSSSSSSSQGMGLNSEWQQTCPVTVDSSLAICDLSSVHTTSVEGATVSLSFYGQGIQIFGSVTSEMAYQVTVDGSTRNGTTAGQSLASISGLSPGDHTVSITAHPSASSSMLSFESAIVTVGTGLTGATITRSVVQDDDASLIYTPTSDWFSVAFDTNGIQHTPSNTTWHQIDGSAEGSVEIPFAGHAILVYGLSRSWFNSPYTVSLDSQLPTTLYGNSALSNTSLDFMYTDGLMFLQPNPMGSLHNLVIKNANGAGVVALDYIEIVTVSGGSPLSGSQSHLSSSRSGSPAVTSSPNHRSRSESSLGVIIGPILGGIALLLLLSVFVIFCRRRPRRQATLPRDSVFVAPTAFDATPSSEIRPTKIVANPMPPLRRPVRHKITTPLPSSSSATAVQVEETQEEPQSAVPVPIPQSELQLQPVPEPEPEPEPPHFVPHNNGELAEELQLVRMGVSRITDMVGDPGLSPRSPVQGEGSELNDMRAIRRDIHRVLELLDQPPSYGP